MYKTRRKIQNKTDVSVSCMTTDHRLLITAILLPAALLSGCMGIYEGGFECPPGKGVGCKSISEVNQMVNDGDLPERFLVDPPHSHGSSQNKETAPKGHEKPEIWYSDWSLEKA